MIKVNGFQLMSPGVNGGGGGLPGYDVPHKGRMGRGRKLGTPIFQKTKSISNNAISDQIYSLSSTISASAPSGVLPTAIELRNTGGVPINVLAGFETWATETSETGATKYLHIMLMPGETWYPPVRAVISTESASTQFDGTPLDSQAPDSNEYTDSTAKTTEGFADGNDTTITFDDASGGVAHLMFRVNDLIRLDDEVCRITSIVDTDDDGAYTPAHFIVDRAVYGTAKADHTNNTAIRFPFFNAYHDFDKYSVAQTDSQGRFKCMNFFGHGRAVSGKQGLVPGSIAFKFYNAGYQELGLTGISSSTNSGLVVSTEYGFDITVDGSGLLTSDYMKFTTDSSDVTFGNVISKMQAALDEQFYTAGSAVFEERVLIEIVGGDLRFTSGQRLSTSAILLAAPSEGEATPFGIGRFPAIGNVDAPVAARLPDDVIYDPITYAISPNSKVFGYDNGFGRLSGMCGGSINYETGALDMIGCPANAEFVYSVAHTSAFSGKLNTGENALVEILANTPSQKWDGNLTIKVY